MVHISAHRCIEAVSDGQVRAVISAIAAACVARKIKLTPLRRHILELVAQTGRPVKAYELLSQLRKERGHAGPPIVYRTLDFLVEHGFLHKVASRSTYVFCQQPGEVHRAPLLVCERCGAVAELADDVLSKALERETRAYGFKPKHGTLEIEGVCAECRSSDA